MPRSISKLMTAVVVTAGLIGPGCGTGADGRLVVPDSPDGTVRIVLTGVAARRPEVVWQALPPSYQSDVSELVRLFADTINPALHQRLVVVARKAVVVLQTNKDLILASDAAHGVAADPVVADVAWEAMIHAADLLLASELADLGALRDLDVEAFLATTGSAIMERAAELPAIGGGKATVADRLRTLARSEVELVSIDGDLARVRVALPDREAVDLDMTRIEGRWVPIELAARWPELVANAEAEITILDARNGGRAELIAFVALGVAESFIDQLAEVETVEEVDQLAGSFAIGPALGRR
jgi:hypothetical protein